LAHRLAIGAGGAAAKVLDVKYGAHVSSLRVVWFTCGSVV
jgi:hypothetical protein